MSLRIVATTDDSTQVLQELGPWLIALVAMVFVGGIVIMLVRRHLRSDADDHAGGYTLHDLRQMHASGDLSDEEFEKARAAMIAGVRAASVREDEADHTGHVAEKSDVDDSGSDETPTV